MGYAGVFTFGQIAFFASARTRRPYSRTAHGVSPWVGILAGGAMAGVVGVLIGLPCLRLKGSYVALLTFGVHMLFSAFVVGSLGKKIGTGGSAGILGIPPLTLFGVRFNFLELDALVLPGARVLLRVALRHLRVIFSHTGTAFIALRDSRTGPRALASRLPLQAAGVRHLGVPHGRHRRVLRPLHRRRLGAHPRTRHVHHADGHAGGRWSRHLSRDGVGRLPGPLLNEYLRVVDVYRPIVFGVSVLLLVLFLPMGILGTLGVAGGAETPLSRRSARRCDDERRPDDGGRKTPETGGAGP